MCEETIQGPIYSVALYSDLGPREILLTDYITQPSLPLALVAFKKQE